MNNWSRLATVGVNLSPASSTSPKFRKPIIIAGLILTLILFGDTLLPVLIHGIVLFLEVLEALCDHVLESYFGLSPWTAQLVTAWTGFFIFLILLVVSMIRIRKAYLVLKRRFMTWLDSFHG